MNSKGESAQSGVSISTRTLITTSERSQPRTARKRGKTTRGRSHPNSKKVVFGLLDKEMGDSNLVFIPVDDAIRLAKVHNAIEKAKTWGTFCKMMPSKDLRYIIEDYRDREEPLPRKRDGFSLPGSYDDGDWPDWPEQMMLSWMPTGIVQKYGKVPCSVLNGHFVIFSMKDADEIIHALTKEGFGCTLNEKLVREACGRLGSTTEL